MASGPVVVVLAAGKGSRFEAAEHKLVQPLGGTTVLGETIVHALASGLPVIVVTTSAVAETARRSVAARDVVLLPEVGTAGQQGLGMGYSIAAGVSARPDASGWVVLPGDMPAVQAATISAVARQLDQHPVVYAQHRGRRGHPVAFAAELYSELALLSGDEGARRIVARYPAHGLEIDDAGVLLDIDTQADLAQLRQRDVRTPG
ncbi:MAG: nucleotidyltransferase family protein [Proteobacteria bacterium]|nr:nucleotidyltransferase family protein [Pseudomonadota bacterium]